MNGSQTFFQGSCEEVVEILIIILVGSLSFIHVDAIEKAEEIDKECFYHDYFAGSQIADQSAEQMFWQ